MQKVIFIDLDGTLTTASTWLSLNLYAGITPEEDHELFQQYLENKIQYNDWIKKIAQLYKSRGSITKDQLIAFANTIELRPDAAETIRKLKEKEYHPVILSGAVDTIVETIAKKLEVEDWFACTQAVYTTDGIFDDFISGGDEAPLKLTLAIAYAEQHSLSLQECIAIDDGGNGVELFKHTKGILLGENKELAPFAWKQVNSLSEITELI